MHDKLPLLVADILASPKYREIAPNLVSLIGAQELAKRGSLKEAVKATRTKLHQVAGAYQQGKMAYADWTERLHHAGIDRAALQAVCRAILANHASTRERLPLLEQFYATLFAGLPPVTSVLDLACGLNPLTIPWMPLAAEARYLAYDIYQDQIAFLNQVFPLLGVAGEAHVCDLLQNIPTEAVDVALLLKTIPCLEQVDKQVGRRLLAGIGAKVLLVSFPAQSLGGRHKGMPANYEAHFRTLIGDAPWRVERFAFATELVFRVTKPR